MEAPRSLLRSGPYFAYCGIPFGIIVQGEFLRCHDSRSMTATKKLQTDGARLTGHIPALDGMRGLACLVVVFHHCFIWPMLFAKGVINPEAFQKAYSREWIPVLVWYGYSGVEFFFLLSGFCLLYPVFSHPEKSFGWRRYAGRRFRRIYPPYAGSLLAAMVLAWVGWSKIVAHLPYATEPLSWGAVIAAVTLTGAHYCLPFWSLVVEAQWYLVVPILAVLWKRSRPAMHGFTLLLGGILLWLTQWASSLGSLALFLPLFWAGVCMAEIATMESDRIRRLLAGKGWWILLLAGVALICRFVQPPPVWAQTRFQIYPFAVFYLGLLSAALFTPSGARWLSSRWLVRLGTFSYSLYLIHALVIYVAIAAFDHYGMRGKRELLLCFTALPALCIACGYLFYLCIEKWTLPRQLPSPPSTAKGNSQTNALAFKIVRKEPKSKQWEYQDARRRRSFHAGRT